MSQTAARPIAGQETSSHPGNRVHETAFHRLTVEGMTTMASYSVQDAQEQIDALRKQVNGLMGDRVTPMLSDAASRAQDAAQKAGTYTREQTEVVASQVRDRPIAAIAIAAAVGYVLGRFVR